MICKRTSYRQGVEYFLELFQCPHPFVLLREPIYQKLYSTSDKTHLNQCITRWYIGRLVLLLISAFFIEMLLNNWNSAHCLLLFYIKGIFYTFLGTKGDKIFDILLMMH